MISSLIWLLLIKLGIIDPVHAPWNIYLPALLVEAVIAYFTIPKVLDKIDKWRAKHE